MTYPARKREFLGGDAARQKEFKTMTILDPGALTTARLKVTLALNAAEPQCHHGAQGQPARDPDRTLTAEIATKSLRKAQAAINEAGADNLALVLQGRLIAGDVIDGAGLSAEPKAHPKAL
jgi:hypothetical protein